MRLWRCGPRQPGAGGLPAPRPPLNRCAPASRTGYADVVTSSTDHGPRPAVAHPPRYLIRNVRPVGGGPVDVLTDGSLIAAIGPDVVPPPDARVLEGNGQLLLPGLVNAHAHLDKSLVGLPWHRNEVPVARLQDAIDFERSYRLEHGLSAEVQSARQLDASLAAGVTHVRSHVDVDTDAGLTNLEGVLATREAYGALVTLQLVAFPQSGMLVRPGTLDLLDEALRLGADCLGGLDPSSMDRDPVANLDALFALADRHGVELDIHLHEPGPLGAFAAELIAERTAALGMRGRVTLSHAFYLGGLADAELERATDLLLEHDIAIMSLGSGNGVFPPLKKLHEAGVRLCTGTDGVRDTWGPYNRADVLDRVRLLGYRCNFRQDADIEMLLRLATFGGAAVMRDTRYGLAVGKNADFLVMPGDAPAQAVAEQAPRRFVFKAGRLVAADGRLLEGVTPDRPPG